MITPLLLAGSLLLPSPAIVAPAPVQLAPPAIFSGRRPGWQPKTRAVASVQAVNPDGSTTAVRCKSEAPAIFSGRSKSRGCQLEEVNPRYRSVAPAIFSGRAPQKGNVIVGPAAYQTARTSSSQQGTYNPTTATYSASGEVTMQPRPKRRAPTIFSGRRAPRTP